MAPHVVPNDPAGVVGRFYVPSRNGATAVVSTNDGHEVLAVNRLDDSFSASPVIVGDVLYLRGETNLYCVAVDGARRPR